ncbi:3-hydroxybenzoate 6-hydroxylase 1 [Mycena venus]|uniref:Protein-S-isoprenylcysteine O-methyltransferase n=1 Tax=Mycena venus TaxID=2733690 RepID=A0A8H6TW93_9AGAR|nr:3-hydroxybenzoate 6-hydroxylase 1 [Mycena venus]
MSLFKLPFIAGATLGLHAASTAPNPPPAPAEKRIEPTRFEFMLNSPLFRNAQKYTKAVYWAAALAEIVMIGGELNTSSPLSERVVSALSFGGSPDAVRITPFLTLGTALVVSGALLRLFCYNTLGKHFTFETAISKNHTLVKTGPYSLVRHPSYTGAVLAYLGLLCYYGSPGSWFMECVFRGTTLGKMFGISYALMMSLIVTGLLSRIEKEDQGLRREFGQDWVDYAAKVPLRTHNLQPRMYFPQAAFKIDVLIVGGGIGGLACAYALGRSGHRVRVLEKTDGCQRGAGVRVPPNLTKILVEWGLGNQMKKCQACRKTTFMSSGKYSEYSSGKKTCCAKRGGQFLLIGYDELYQMLHRLALSVGAVITFNAAVTGADSATIPSVYLENGTTLTADLIIGADGGKSIIREVLTETEDTAADSGHTWYTAIVPIERMIRDPDLEKWAHVPQWPIWMGDNRCSFGFPIGNDYSFSLYWPDTDVPTGAPEGWNVYCPTSILDLSSYDDRVRRLFNMVPTAQRVKYVLRDRIEEWVDHSGRMVLIGEAAHPLLPHSTHGASMAVEDAEALGVLMSRLRSREQIPQLTEGFQELRKKRCEFIHLGELSNASLTTMRPGEGRDMRDAGLRESLETGIEHWDDGALRDQWEQIEEGFAYHAREASEDWWRKWGSLSDKSGDGELVIKVATT